jgi:cell wall-associated NlpC family hydrolase
VSNQEKVAARARALVGVPFRPQGRSAGYGLDCVGLAALAAGVPEALVPADYRLRSVADQGIEAAQFGGWALPIPPDDAGTGDVVLVRYAPGQHHLLVLVQGGFVHAHAGLGRVVETPGEVAWPRVAAWRVMRGVD